MAHAIYVFDAYGTLFDVHAAVRRHADEVGPEGQLLSALWRAKQLEYSWMLTMMGRYRDFWSLTEEALDYAFARVPEANRASRQHLLDSYWSCDVYPDVPEVIKQLKLRGAKLVILSNGTQAMLRAACRSARSSRTPTMMSSRTPIQFRAPYWPRPALRMKPPTTAPSTATPSPMPMTSQLRPMRNPTAATMNPTRERCDNRRPGSNRPAASGSKPACVPWRRATQL